MGVFPLDRILSQTVGSDINIFSFENIVQGSHNPKIAIIGAGVSGLAAAWALKDSDWEVSVFEKSR